MGHEPRPHQKARTTSGLPSPPTFVRSSRRPPRSRKSEIPFQNICCTVDSTNRVWSRTAATTRFSFLPSSFRCPLQKKCKFEKKFTMRPRRRFSGPPSISVHEKDPPKPTPPDRKDQRRIRPHGALRSQHTENVYRPAGKSAVAYMKTLVHIWIYNGDKIPYDSLCPGRTLKEKFARLH